MKTYIVIGWYSLYTDDYKILYAGQDREKAFSANNDLTLNNFEIQVWLDGEVIEEYKKKSDSSEWHCSFDKMKALKKAIDETKEELLIKQTLYNELHEKLSK